MDLSVDKILERTNSNSSLFKESPIFNTSTFENTLDHTFASSTVETTGDDSLKENKPSKDHKFNHHQPIKFKVRKVSNEATKPSTDNKQMKSVQLQYDQCTNKIMKITKEINFLNNLLPPYNVEIDYQTRSKITKAIEKLKMKIDELEKKKYTLGIALSRLWRDLDDSDVWARSTSN